MSPATPTDARDAVLQAAPGRAAMLAAAGVRTVADLLARATCVRDLADRANHRLAAGGLVLWIKQEKPRRGRPGSREARHLALARDLAGVPVPELVAHGHAAGTGAVAATLDLAPARPLDDLLREDALPPAVRRRVADDLADAVARLHAHGLHHRDLYLNHVYVDPAASAPLVALIDWDRLGHHRRPLARRVVKDLAALLASAPPTSVRERLRFLVRWRRGVGVPAARTRGLLRRVGKKARRIRAHRPRTPVGEAARPRPGGGA